MLVLVLVMLFLMLLMLLVLLKRYSPDRRFSSIINVNYKYNGVVCGCVAV